MTVAEMIAHLQKQPPDMPVCVFGRDDCIWLATEPYVTTTKIESRRYSGTVYSKRMSDEDWAKVQPETALVI